MVYQSNYYEKCNFCYLKNDFFRSKNFVFFTFLKFETSEIFPENIPDLENILDLLINKNVNRFIFPILAKEFSLKKYKNMSI